MDAQGWGIIIALLGTTITGLLTTLFTLMNQRTATVREQAALEREHRAQLARESLAAKVEQDAAIQRAVNAALLKKAEEAAKLQAEQSETVKVIHELTNNSMSEQKAENAELKGVITKLNETAATKADLAIMKAENDVAVARALLTPPPHTQLTRSGEAATPSEPDPAPVEVVNQDPLNVRVVLSTEDAETVVESLPPDETK